MRHSTDPRESLFRATVRWTLAELVAYLDAGEDVGQYEHYTYLELVKMAHNLLGEELTRSEGPIDPQAVDRALSRRAMAEEEKRKRGKA